MLGNASRQPHDALVQRDMRGKRMRSRRVMMGDNLIDERGGYAPIALACRGAGGRAPWSR